MTRPVLSIVMTVFLIAISLPATAAWLRPVSGDGYFEFTCDAVNLPRDDGAVDVAVLVAVPHRQLTFIDDAGTLRARVRTTVVIDGLDGRQWQAARSLRLNTRSPADADSPVLRQEFTLVVRGVEAPAGMLTVKVEDLNRQRPGLGYLGSEERAFARVTTDWESLPRRETAGLAVGDAVFLAHAPIREWGTTGRPTPAGHGGPWEYINPMRRYGLEVEHVQAYFNLEPPRRAEDRMRAAGRSLLVRIESDRLDFALVDTIETTPVVRRALTAGHPAAIYWEMDAGGLPPGSYRMSLAPLDSVGRGLLTSFDVVWSLAQMMTDHDLLLGEARTVLGRDELARFEGAPRSEQPLILDEFWRGHDPDPEDPYNPARAEFRRRIDHVQRFLGGFGDQGAEDPRGEVYLLLGRPDAAHEEVVPMNEDVVNAAREMVFDRFQQMTIGSTGTAPWDFTDYAGTGQNRPGSLSGFVPHTYMGDIIAASSRISDNSRSFLLWRYDEAGEQLFRNSYSGKSGGLRFLFIDQTGLGDYRLDATNARSPTH